MEDRSSRGLEREVTVFKSVSPARVSNYRKAANKPFRILSKSTSTIDVYATSFFSFFFFFFFHLSRIFSSLRPSLPLEFSTSLPKAERRIPGKRIPFAESKAAINVEISTKLFVGSPRYTERRYLIGREEAHPLASSPRSRTPAREIPEDRFERARGFAP